MSVRPRTALLVCLAVLSASLVVPGHAQPTPADGQTRDAPVAPAEPAQALDEITVNGERSVTQLWIDVGKATENFWSLLNAKLGDTELAVTCETEARLGTLIKHRVCRTGYQQDEIEKSAYAYYTMGGLYDPTVVSRRKNGEFVDKVVAAVNSSPELQSAIVELERRKAAYEAAAQQENGARQSRRGASREKQARQSSEARRAAH